MACGAPEMAYCTIPSILRHCKGRQSLVLLYVCCNLLLPTASALRPNAWPSAVFKNSLPSRNRGRSPPRVSSCLLETGVGWVLLHFTSAHVAFANNCPYLVFLLRCSLLSLMAGRIHFAKKNGLLHRGHLETNGTKSTYPQNSNTLGDSESIPPPNTIDRYAALVTPRAEREGAMSEYGIWTFLSGPRFGFYRISSITQFRSSCFNLADVAIEVPPIVGLKLRYPQSYPPPFSRIRLDVLPI